MQRLIGVVLGALATYLLLLVLDGSSGDPATGFAIAVIVGAVISYLWPWVIGFILKRRGKAQRERLVADEVDRRMAEKDRDR